MRTPSLSTLALAVCLPASLAMSQVKPGHSIHSIAIGGTTNGQLWTVDHEAGTAKMLTLASTGSTANPLITDRANAILMTSQVVGYVGSSPASGTSNIYSIQVIGSNVTAKKLNTNALAGANLSQIVFFKKDANHSVDTLYFPTQNASGGSGILYSIPAAGGAATQVADLGASPVGATGLANAACRLGTVVYVGFWDLTTTRANGGELAAYDTATKKAVKVMDLPKGKHLSGSNRISPGIVSMHPDHVLPTRVVLFGIYGDIITVDPDQGNGFKNPKVVSHDFGGRFTSATTTANNLINSVAPDSSGHDWIVGSRDSHVERYVSGHSAEKIVPAVGGSGTHSINGSHYFPVPNNFDRTYGAGCAGPAGFVPSDVAYGAAVPGNKNFAFGLHSGDGGASFLLALGITNLSIGSTKLPFQFPGTNCSLRMAPLVVIAGKLTGNGNGNGKAKIPVALPTGIPKGTRVFRQWAMNNTGGGFSLSNAREIRIQ